MVDLPSFSRKLLTSAVALALDLPMIRIKLMILCINKDWHRCIYKPGRWPSSIPSYLSSYPISSILKPFFRDAHTASVLYLKWINISKSKTYNFKTISSIYHTQGYTCGPTNPLFYRPSLIFSNQAST